MFTMHLWTNVTDVKSKMVVYCHQRKGDNKSERKQSSSHYLRQGKQKVEKIPPQHPTSQRPICTKGKVWFWQFFNLFIRPRVEDFSSNQVGGGELCPFSSKLVHLFCLLLLFILICFVFSFLSNQTPSLSQSCLPFSNYFCLRLKNLVSKHFCGLMYLFLFALRIRP